MTPEKVISKSKGLVGTIISHKMQKTAVVRVSRYEKHPKYGKYISKDSKFKAHDEADAYKEGDTVRIIPCRPMSKDKHFMIVEKIK